MFLKNKSVTNYNREKIHRQLACNVSRIKDMKKCFISMFLEMPNSYEHMNKVTTNN